jgi:hypothetical protein
MAIFKVLSEINLSLYSLFGKKIGFDRSFLKKYLSILYLGNFFGLSEINLSLFLIWQKN